MASTSNAARSATLRSGKLLTAANNQSHPIHRFPRAALQWSGSKQQQVQTTALQRQYATTRTFASTSSTTASSLSSQPYPGSSSSSSSDTTTSTRSGVSNNSLESSSASASIANTPASASSSSSSQEAAPKGNVESMSPFQQSLLRGVGKIMGYSSRTAAAVRTTSDYYDRCAERDEREATFFYDECGLPISYQSWMQITNLHVWLLSVRFRSLPAPLGKTYIQEMINHYFIHSESLMRGRYKVKQARLIKGYLRDMLYQYHGANMGYDEGLISENDAILTAAVWRNLFGAGWAKMGGVKGKLNQDNLQQENTPSSSSSLDNLNLDPSLPPTPDPLLDAPNLQGGQHAGGSGLVDRLPPHVPAELEGIVSREARFALNLERLVRFIRSEVNRMQKIPDELIIKGFGAAAGRAGIDQQQQQQQKGGLTDFSRI